jgi:hypothetical protein
VQADVEINWRIRKLDTPSNWKAPIASLTMPPPPAFGSMDEAAEMAELYWMAMARDVPFTSYLPIR